MLGRSVNRRAFLAALGGSLATGGCAFTLADGMWNRCQTDAAAQAADPLMAAAIEGIAAARSTRALAW